MLLFYNEASRDILNFIEVKDAIGSSIFLCILLNCLLYSV
jgi:hypothetical protein